MCSSAFDAVLGLRRPRLNVPDAEVREDAAQMRGVLHLAQFLLEGDPFTSQLGGDLFMSQQQPWQPLLTLIEAACYGRAALTHGASVSRSKPSRITRVSATPVLVSRCAPFKSALGLSKHGGFGIVRVETDTGLTGIGEISMIWNGDGSASFPMVENLIGPALEGLSPFDLTRAIQRMDQTVQFTRAANPAKAAVEMALHDIVGHALDVPVYDLLGWPRRKHRTDRKREAH
jgi:hypothetical protein